MSQHVIETCNEGSGLWLPLTEYSVRSGVSLSTIRRKIKSNSIPHRLEKGRYLILFQGNSELREAEQDVQMEAPANPLPVRTVPPPSAPQATAFSETEEAVRMVSEAFEMNIQKLEERNRELEQRVNELQLLVRVLEEKYEVRY